MHFSFSSKMGWFPVYLWFNIDYHGFIDLSNLSFVCPKSEFRPNKHQKSPLTASVWGREIMSKKAMANALAKQAQPSESSQTYQTIFWRDGIWDQNSVRCWHMAEGVVTTILWVGELFPHFFWRWGRHFTFAELNMSSLKGNEWHRVLTNHQTS